MRHRVSIISAERKIGNGYRSPFTLRRIGLSKRQISETAWENTRGMTRISLVNQLLFVWPGHDQGWGFPAFHATGWLASGL